MRSAATVIPTIPEPARKVLRNGVWAYGWATSPFRPLPDFLVLGAQKAGEIGQACRRLAALSDVRMLASLCRP